MNDLAFPTWNRLRGQIPEVSRVEMLGLLRAPPFEELPRPPRLLVGAPLEVGDVIVYVARPCGELFESREVGRGLQGGALGHGQHGGLA